MTDIDSQELATPPNPVDRAIMGDLADVRLLAAADDGRFGFTSYEFPIVIGWISVGNEQLAIRLDCTGYPAQAPAGCLWESVSGLPLGTDRWPIGGGAEAVFRKDWSPTNGNAPYLACDRVALSTHPDWQQSLIGRVWSSNKTVFNYFEQVHDALVGAHLPISTATTL